MIDAATLAQMNGECVRPPEAGPAWRAAHAAGIEFMLEISEAGKAHGAK